MNASVYKRQWDVNSFTNPRQKPYKVSERNEGGFECSCPAWTMHTPRRDCKHIMKVRSALIAMPAAPVFAVRQPEAAPVQREQRKDDQIHEVVFDGYTIRKRHVLDGDTAPNLVATATRSRREL